MIGMYNQYINVANCSTRAAKSMMQNLPMPNDDIGKIFFLHTAPSDRSNNRAYGSLRGKGLSKAQRIVDRFGGLGISGEYGSIEIGDFIPNGGDNE